MRSFVSLALLLFIITACATPTANPAAIPSSTPDTASPTATNSKGTIRFSYPATPGIADVPFFMALDRLREQGYTVETQQFARFDLNLAALVKGDLDIASSSLQPAWAAVAKDAPIRTIVARLRNADLVAATTNIKTCSDLNHKNVGLSSGTAVNAVLLNQYIARHCPGTAYTLVPIPNSTNRVAALATGTLDATNVQLDDMLELEHVNPGKFHALVNFSDEFPNIQAFAFHVHQDFAGQHPEAVRDFVRAFVESSRTLQDKQVLRENMSKYLELDSAILDAAAVAFTENKMWDVNGGLTADNVETTLDFFIEADAVPNTLTPEIVADLSFLSEVLAEIGKE